MAHLVWTARLRKRLKPHEEWTYLVYDKAAGRYWRYGAASRTLDCLELRREEAVRLYRQGIRAYPVEERPEDDARAMDAILEACRRQYPGEGVTEGRGEHG